MITLTTAQQISPIFLTVMLIIYLITAELGDKRIKETLLPFIVSFMLIFLIILGIYIKSQF